MENIFADRISDVPRSFIREILKVTADPSIISFAGGLPNRDYFPVREIGEACARVMTEDGAASLQYSTSEGYPPLRKFISDRYRATQGLCVDPDDIIITSGSQQGLDLIGKTLLNDNDPVGIEDPGYLGAIQAFSIYKAKFHPVTLRDDGIDIDIFQRTIREHCPKIFYAVTNFQNPTGVTYSLDKREAIAGILAGGRTLIIEDNPYGELRFRGKDLPLVRKIAPERTILLGSFSKIVAPGFRIGWICMLPEIMDGIVIAKQASDLHTNYFTQRVLHRYLEDNDLDAHIQVVREAYGKQRDAMLRMIRGHFPEEVRCTEPDGGMFLWVRLPKGINSLDLFKIALSEKVAFVPGTPFYTAGGGGDTLRLNFSNTDESLIEEGIRRLGAAIKKLLAVAL